MKRLHLAGLASMATTLGGLLLSPEILGVLSPKWSAVVIAAGTLAQAATRAVHKGDVMEVPKPEAPQSKFR